MLPPSNIVHCTFCTVHTLHMCMLFPLIVNPFITTDPRPQMADNGDVISFTCIAIAFPAPSYSWNTPITDETFNTSTINIDVVYSYFGNYTCTASSMGQTAVSNTALLTGKCKRCVSVYIVCVCVLYFLTIVVETFLVTRSPQFM